MREPAIAVLWAAATADEARRRLVEAPVDLLVVDLTLEAPGDGLDLTRELAAEHPDLRLVALNGTVDPGLEQMAIEAGAARFLNKSSAPPAIVSALREVGAQPARRRRSRNDGLGQRPARIGIGAVRKLLSERELEVLNQIRLGRTNREIAQRLGISISTVNKHVHHVLTKLEAKNRAHAASMFGSRPRASD